MARGVTPRPRRGALRKIPLDLKSTSSVEIGKLLELHARATAARVVRPASTNTSAAGRSQAIAGGRTESRMNLKGGSFGPTSKDKFR